MYTGLKVLPGVESIEIHVSSDVQKYVFTQLDTDRSVYLYVNIPPATPGLLEHYHDPVLQHQSPHHDVMHVTETTCALFQV